MKPIVDSEMIKLTTNKINFNSIRFLSKLEDLLKDV